MTLLESEVGHSQVLYGDILLLNKCASEKRSKRNVGLQLKRINAAFSGIDVARGLGANESTIQQLSKLAEKRLRELTE